MTPRVAAAEANPYRTFAAAGPLWPEMRVAAEPPRRLAGDEYAERFLRLPGTEGERAGRFSFAAVPYQREPLQKATNPRVRSVVLMWPPQTGKTTLLMAFAAWVIACRPTNVLWTQAEWADVTHTFLHRLVPTVQATDDLRRFLPGRRGVTSTQVLFRNGARFFGASGRASNSMRGKPIEIAISDETSAWPTVAKLAEGSNPIDLVEARMLSYRRRMHLMASTPVLADDAFDQAFAETDQRRFLVPCPSCGVFAPLEEANLRWPESLTARDALTCDEIRYLCRECGSDALTDDSKLAALRLGRWVPIEAEYDPRTGDYEERWTDLVGYRLNALYSPTVRLAQYVAMILRARKSPGRYAQTLDNLWRAVGWRPTVSGGAALPETRIVKGFRRGMVPACTIFLTAGVDVQADHFVWVIVAWSFDERAWLVDHGRSLTWPELDAALFGREWQVADVPGAPEPVAPRKSPPALIRVCVDMADGNRTDEVYAYGRERPVLVMPARGSMTIPTPTSLRRIKPQTKIKAAVGQLFVVWSNPHFFSKLAAAMQPAADRGGLALPEDVSQQHLAELSATRLVARKMRDGTIRAEWEEGRENHGFDAHCMAWVAADLAGITKFQRDGVAGARSGEQAERLRRRKLELLNKNEAEGRPRWRRGGGSR